MKIARPLLVMLMLQGGNALAGETERSVVLRAADRQVVITGDARTDFFGGTSAAKLQVQQETENGQSPIGRKSPWLAAGLSALVPGSGEYYAESYWKAAAFLAAEVALVALAYSFDNRADKQDAANGTFADEHWSVVRYAQEALQRFPPNDPSRYQNMINPNTSLPPWERINWGLLNQLEREIGATAEGRSFSHTLPQRPEQQYFELIGKYGQYSLGWDDFNGVYTPFESSIGGRFRYYADQRQRAEDLYSTASTFVTITIINHLLSAADAAWTATTFNKHLHASMRLQAVPVRFGIANVPVARLEYVF